METRNVVLLVLLGLVVVATLAVAVFFLVRLLRMRTLLRSSAMPVSGKVAFWAALIYSVSPADLLPDPVYLDDIGILVGAIGYLGHLARKHGVIGRRAPHAPIEERRAAATTPPGRGAGSR
ncbi:YkvA family protein [Micromonospora sp. NPDC049559]|uniref:YkvA family protein n=1 Tax=Micromonospora sp. NPDC049559 TaxID=3155923 RepID=UPI0034259638